MLTTARHKDVYIDGVRVVFKRVRPSLMYGFSKVDGAMVADPEKAIVDMLYLGMSNYSMM